MYTPRDFSKDKSDCAGIVARDTSIHAHLARVQSDDVQAQKADTQIKIADKLYEAADMIQTMVTSAGGDPTAAIKPIVEQADGYKQSALLYLVGTEEAPVAPPEPADLASASDSGLTPAG